MKHLRPSFLLVLLFCLPLTVIQAGGIYLYEKSATDVGLGSAGWTARAGDASTIFSNPAGLTRLEGQHLDGRRRADGDQVLHQAGKIG